MGRRWLPRTYQAYSLTTELRRLEAGIPTNLRQPQAGWLLRNARIRRVVSKSNLIVEQPPHVILCSLVCRLSTELETFCLNTHQLLSQACMRCSMIKASGCFYSTTRLFSNSKPLRRVYSKNDTEAKIWPTIKQWVNLVNEAFVKFGKEFNLGPQIKEYMSSVGFVDIHEKYVKIPVGPWAKGKKNKEIGALQREHFCDCVVSNHNGFVNQKDG